MTGEIQIDAHQHFWHPARGDYGWMSQDDPVLSRPYGPADLADSATNANITQTVLVQAAPSIAETEYMLGIADSTSHVAAVVGWIDFERPDQIDTLRRFAAHPKFVGVRPMIQDIPDKNWMLHDDVQWAFEAISELDLTFDALGFPQHAENFGTILRNYPHMRAVLNHCLKPQIRNHSPGRFQAWADDMTQLAEDSQVFCKLSGLVTEASASWTAEDLYPYVDHVLSTFTPDRTMWGSDWPVVRLRCEYEEWYAIAKKLTDQLHATERARIFGGTAREFYRLDDMKETEI